MFKKIGVVKDELFNTRDEVLVCSFWGEGCEKTCVKKLLWTFYNPFLTPLFWGFFRMGFVPSCKGECSVGTRGVDPVLWHIPSCVRSWMTLVWFHMCHPTKKAGALFGCFSCVSVLELYPTHHSLQMRFHGMLWKPISAFECCLSWDLVSRFEELYAMKVNDSVQ